MKRTLSGLVSVIILFAVFCLFNTNVAIAATITIKLQSAYPKSTLSAKNFLFFAEKVEEYTNGEIKVRVFWPGQLVKTKEALSALQRGMIEGYGGSFLYFAGVVPEGNTQWLPYTWKDSGELVDLYLKHGYLDLEREAFASHGLYYVAPLAAGTLGWLTKFPIHKMEDMKGKKIRASGMTAEMVKALGGVPVSLASVEQYMALQRGTIDGVAYPNYAIEAYKFYEVLNNVSLPGTVSPCICEIVFNLKVWNKLSSDHKKAIDRAGMEAMWRSLVFSDLMDSKVLNFCKEKGVQITTLSPKELKRVKEVAAKIYETHAKKSDFCSKQVEIIKKYLK